MTLILVGALLFIAGVVYTALQPLKGRLSRPRTVSPTPDGKTLEPERPGRGLIPSPFNQHPCAQSRSPIDMILQGWAVSLFQVSEQ